MAYTETEIFALQNAGRNYYGKSSTFDFSDSSHITAHLTVISADTVDFPPRLSVFFEESLDGDNWATIGTFPAVQSIGVYSLDFKPIIGKRVRAIFIYSGSNFGFGLQVASK